MTPLGQVGLHAGTFLTGIVAATTVMAGSGVDLYAAYNHLATGVKEIGLAWAIIGPALLAGIAAYKSTTRNKLKDVVAAPDAVAAAKEMPATPKAIAVADALKSNGR